MTMAAYDAEVSENTEVAIYQWLWEVCSTKLLQGPIVFGGRGVIVQIDESLFRHKPKLTDSSRYYVTFLIDDYAYAQVVSRFAGHGKWA